MATYRVHSIDYDTDGADVLLPEILLIEITATDPNEIEQTIADEISNITGWCHNGFLYDIVA